MNKNCSTTTDSFVEPSSLWAILKTEKRWYLCGAVFVFLLASVLISGWPQGLIPNTAYPYAYSGDSLGYSWLIQRAMEGWVFENPRNGYPFGSNFLDYPGSDAGTLALLKLIGLLSGSFYAAFNLYFLLSFYQRLHRAAVAKSLKTILISCGTDLRLSPIPLFETGPLFLYFLFCGPAVFLCGDEDSLPG